MGSAGVRAAGRLAYGVGRHSNSVSNIDDPPLYLFWYGWCPLELKLQRNKSTKPMVPSSDWGSHHVISEDAIRDIWKDKYLPRCSNLVDGRWPELNTQIERLKLRRPTVRGSTDQPMPAVSIPGIETIGVQAVAQPTKPLPRRHIAFGPEMPGWGSWEWVGADLAQAFGGRATTFTSWQEPDADVVVVVKHAPPAEWVEHISPKAKVIYCPIDFFGSADEIAAHAEFLKRCSRIIVHCERLQALFLRYAPTIYLDHHIKYASAPRQEFAPSGNILWAGVRSNLPALVEWVNAHPLPAPLDVLTNPETAEAKIEPGAFGFHSGFDVRIHRWSAELQRQMTASARVAIDIKADDFRSRHKPPAKAIDFIVSNVPIAMNPDSSPAEHLARLGLLVALPLDVERWLSREYWEETRRLGEKLRAELSFQDRAGEIGRRKAVHGQSGEQKGLVFWQSACNQPGC